MGLCTHQNPHPKNPKNLGSTHNQKLKPKKRIFLIEELRYYVKRTKSEFEIMTKDINLRKMDTSPLPQPFI